MKIFKIIFRATALSMCILVGGFLMPFQSYAKEVTISNEERMISISTCYTELSISNTGTATIVGEVREKNGSTTAYIKVTLQKLNGGKWIDVEKWEDTQEGSSALIYETYKVSRGTYRTVMVCNVNGESASSESASKYY